MNVVTSGVSLTVVDPAASRSFFTTHLGFREAEEAEGYVLLVRDDAAADLVLLERDPELPRPHRPGGGFADMAVSLTVTDVAAEHERLRRECPAVTGPLESEPWGELRFRLTDPNGVVVQLLEWQPPAGAPGRGAPAAGPGHRAPAAGPGRGRPSPPHATERY
ncbi:VOC family protein [Streptomyces sp. NPDC089799]|uniref:VOC family protein n=1 Tax=Streptomyces sp. NPDC089799 TaxID=3155066 RepID=UPI00341354D8